MRQCQIMHSSIGTGSLAYVVGSKVMDMRTSSKDNDAREASTISRQASDDTANTIGACTQSNNGCTDTSYTHLRKCSSNQSELVSVRASAEGAAYDSSYHVSSPAAYDCLSTEPQIEIHRPQYAAESFFDFPSLPVTNLFQNGDRDMSGVETHDGSMSVSEDLPRYDDDHMHSFQINNNVDLIMESDACSNGLLHASYSENEIFSSDERNHANGPKEMRYNTETVNGLRILDASVNLTSSNGQIASEDRVSEWLWTLHRIGKFLSCLPIL